MRESGQPRRLTWVLRIRMTTLSRTCTNGSTGSRKKAGQTWSNVPIPPSFRLKAENRADWLRKNSFILKTPPATASLRRKEKYSGSFWKTGSPASSGANCSGGYSPAVPPPWKSACLLPSPAEKTPFTFPGPSPAAAASPSPLKNSTTTGWAAPNPFLLATGKRKPGPQVITPYSKCSPGKNSGKGSWTATARHGPL